MSNAGIISTDALRALVTVEEQQMVLNAGAIVKGLLPIPDDANAIECRMLLEDLAGLHKQLEDRRKEVKAPYLACERAIDAAVRPHTDPLETMIRDVKSLLTAYAAKSAAAKRAADRAAAESVAAGEIPPITAEVIRAQASVKVVKTRAHEEVFIENANLIPPEFMMPDLVKIKAAVAAGRSIPGVGVKITDKAVR